MTHLKFFVLVFTAWLTATTTLTADDTSRKLDRPAEIVVIGDGEMMDALQRALEDEVAIINEDGGVMGWPLKVTRVDEACDADTPAVAIAKARGIAARSPLLVFQSYCNDSGLPSAATYAGRNVLYMGIGQWPAELTEKRAGPTVFRLAPNHLDVLETAFLAATTATARLEVLGAGDDASRATIKELRQGFSATAEEVRLWGKLLDSGAPAIGGLAEMRAINADGGVGWKYDRQTMSGATVLVFPSRDDATGQSAIRDLAGQGWRGLAIFRQTAIPDDTEADRLQWLSRLPSGVEVQVFQPQPFYLGNPPEGAKAYTAFHPDWVAGFWQVMKAVKFAKSLEGREIAATLGGKPFFSRAPWLMLQSQSRYQPPELRQRFNDNGNLRMAGYKLEKIWPKE
ncbi:MAG: ABC transporter substrate-binding protein [Alphaproteobacteria bacterium]|nr:ABC transporter substrate-binding protein [Alphaproteobacteria bacterium]